MLTKSAAQRIAIIIRDEMQGSSGGRPLKPRIEVFMKDLADLMRYEELRPTGREEGRDQIERISRLSAELATALGRPMPELYGALLELKPTRSADSRIGTQPIEQLVKDLETLQRAASTALLDVYRRPSHNRSHAILRFLSYRVAVLLDSHFGEGTATEVRGRLFEQVLRAVLKECGITPPADLNDRVLPQALKILRQDQSSTKPI